MPRPVHIGLNLVFLVPGETGGMETAARSLLPALAAAAPRVRFTAFVNRAAAGEPGPWGEVMETVTVPVDARDRIQWVRGEQTLLPRLAQRAGCDLVHSLGSTAPALGRFVRVVTVHDLIYRRIPEAHAGLRAAGMRALVPLAARRSRRVLVPSRATRDDVVALLRVPGERIDVVPWAAGRPTVEATAEPDLRRRLGLGDRRFLLSASAKRPHKNLVRLLEAHALLGEGRPLLVLPGYATAHEQQLRDRAAQLGVAGDVSFLGWIDERDLEGLLAATEGVVFPSLYEGFGLPVLEAMQRGVPVACSSRASLAEVAGDAARLFDAEDPVAMAQALRVLLDDRGEAQRLRRRGLEQAARFTWRRAALGHLSSYERALGHPLDHDRGPDGAPDG